MQNKRFSFAGRVVVLTGAASGIGAALARGLADRGAHLGLIDRDEAGLARIVEALRRKGRVAGYTVDLADQAAIAHLPTRVAGELGAASVLINNAGIALAGTFEQVSAARFEHLFAVNFFAVTAMTRAFLPQLREYGPAQIVNMSSIFGIIGSAGQTAYSASKFAVRGFSESLRAELAGSDVGVSVIHPGGVRTNIAVAAMVEAGLSAEQIAAARGPSEARLRMDAAQAAEQMLRGLERRRKRILVGEDAKIAARIQRLFPASYDGILRKLTRAE